jgi:hypothetical protein
MDLISLLILLIIVGGILYVVSILPIHGTIKTIIYVVACIALAVYLLRGLAPAVSL